MDLLTFFRVIIRHWWLILLATLATAGSAAYMISLQAPVYQAVTTIELRPSLHLEDTRDVIDAVAALERRTMINTVARKATGNSTIEEAAVLVGIAPQHIVDAELTALVLPETNLIEIRANSTNPELAAAITNAVANVLRAQMPERAFELEVIDAAVPPVIPIEPQPVRTMTLAILFGLGLGVAFALLSYLIQTLYRSGTEDPNRAIEPEGVGAEREARGAKQHSIVTQ